MPTPEPIRKKSPEQQLREALNEATVEMVSEGFQALDRAAETGLDYVKRAILRGITGRKGE